VRRARTRTVLGVLLTRAAPDIWSASGWNFQIAEGQSLGGRQEWWASPPGGGFTVCTSLRESVQTMLRATKGDS
jgi:hypothetical protein